MPIKSPTLLGRKMGRNKKIALACDHCHGCFSKEPTSKLRCPYCNKELDFEKSSDYAISLIMNSNVMSRAEDYLGKKNGK